MDRVPAFASTAVSLKIARHSVAACLPEDLRVTAFCKREGLAVGRHRRRATASSDLIVGPLQAGKLAFLNDGRALPERLACGRPLGGLCRATPRNCAPETPAALRLASPKEQDPSQATRPGSWPADAPGHTTSMACVGGVSSSASL